MDLSTTTSVVLLEEKHVPIGGGCDDETKHLRNANDPRRHHEDESGKCLVRVEIERVHFRDFPFVRDWVTENCRRMLWFPVWN